MMIGASAVPHRRRRIASARAPLSALLCGALLLQLLGVPSQLEEKVQTAREMARYSFLRYASRAARSSGNGWRLNVTPSVVATGGGGPGGAFALINLYSSM